MASDKHFQEEWGVKMADASELDRLLHFFSEIDTAALRDGSVNNYADSLRNVPSSIVIAGVTLRISASLWRDFMPTAESGGSHLIAVVKGIADSPAVPPTRATRLAIVHDTMIWTSPVLSESATSSSSPFKVVAREGPKWGPDVVVDVILEIRDPADRPHLVRAADQLIFRTD
jgi:hypothetical protein